ncbi:MAG TPA: universal stress protein [Stenomitos sp.]
MSFIEQAMNFRKIVIAINESPLAPFVFAQSLALAEKKNAICKIFHCIDSSSLSYYAPIRSLTSAEERIQKLLKIYQQKAKTSNVSAEFGYEIGEPGRAICNFAQRWKADLVIVGRRGNSGLDEMLVGSVSNYVVHHAPCSVLVIQGKAVEEKLAADNSANALLFNDRYWIEED